MQYLIQHRQPRGVRCRAFLFAFVALAVGQACDRQSEFPTGPRAVVSPISALPTVLGATVVTIPRLNPNAGPNGIAINDAGEVAGYANVASGQMHAFRWTPGGGTEDLGTLGGDFSWGYGINASGQVVGYSLPPIHGSSQHAFLWTPGLGMTDLGTFDGGFSVAFGINDAGHVVGSSTINATDLHAFLWVPAAAMRDLGTLGGGSSRARAISDGEHVVGSANTVSGESHAFLWTPRQGMQDLGTLGGVFSEAWSVNDAGWVVGVSETADGHEHAFLWRAGIGMQDLGTLGASYSIAYGINNAGTIVGYSRLPNGVDHAFVWTPADGMEDLYPFTGIGEAMAINNYGQVVGGGRVATLTLSNHAPVANPGGPYAGAKKKPVAFDGSRSADPDGDALAYVWDFGDGGPLGGGATPTHEYETWGTFTVTLTVQDPAGLSAMQTTTAVIAPPGHRK